MNCPKCTNPTVEVTNTYPHDTHIERRKQCRTCKHVFKTLEHTIDSPHQEEINGLLKRLLPLIGYR